MFRISRLISREKRSDRILNWLKKVVPCSISIVFVIVFASPSRAAKVDSEVAGSLLRASSSGTGVRVILKFKGGGTPGELLADIPNEDRGKRLTKIVQRLRESSGSARREIERRLEKGMVEGTVSEIRPLWVVNAVAIEASAELIEELSTRTDVEEIIPDKVLRLAAPLPSAVVPGTWNIDRIGVRSLWGAGFRGDGVVVATLDTGADIRHPEFGNKWRGGAADWFVAYSPDPLPHGIPSDDDPNGHGTRVMGLLVGGDIGGAPTGIAPEAKWIAAKVFSNSGESSYSAIHAAFQWALDPDGDPATLDAPDVVNCSWDLENPGGYLAEFEPDIRNLKTAGIAVVFAAGNSGPASSTSTSPGNNPGALAIGAIGSDDLVAGFSSRGPSSSDGSVYPSLVAPGVGIRTTDLWFGSLATSYTTVSGTSYSAPHAAGSLALLFSADPALTADQAEGALKQAAIDFGQAAPDNSYGYGLLDVDRAARVLGILPPLPVPDGDADGDGILTIGDVLAVLRTAVGANIDVNLTTTVRTNGDVAPLINGVPAPDGKITIADVLTLLHRYVGAISW